MYHGRGGGGGGAAGAALSEERNLMRLQDCLVALDEYVGEKRGKNRENLLRRTFRAVSMGGATPPVAELVRGQADTIHNACLYAIRAGEPAEQYVGCRVLEASVIVHQAADEWMTQGLDRQLRRLATAPGRAVPVRIAALRALCMSALIGHASLRYSSSDLTADTHDSQSLMDLCEKLVGGATSGSSSGPYSSAYTGEDASSYAAAESSSSSTFSSPTPFLLRAAALDCWALLGTTLPDSDLAGSAGGGDGGGGQDDDGDEHLGRGLAVLAVLKDCLDSSSIELRSAAGECVSLIHEARLSLGIPRGGEGMARENVTTRRYRRGSWDGTPWEVLMDEVRQRISELSTENDHRMSKKAKKEQRATFREFMATLVDDESPEETVSFRENGILTLTSWREIIQLNFVRHCLQGGFQIQLLTNPTLQSLFGADGCALGAVGWDAPRASNLSSVEKRLLLSKTSEAAKSAHRDMRKQRRKRENVKNHFLTADGDDI
jgi:transposase